MNRFFALAVAVLAGAVCSIRAAEPPASTPAPDQPRPIPLTRPEMKQYLEDMKLRKPRIPLPEITEEEKANAGERGLGYESRLRSHYLPEGSGGFSGGGGGTRPPGGNAPPGGGNTDPAMSLDGTFKTELFWIVCRMNNCQYCQGHQEGKLLRGGRKEDEIAALDGDWSGFPAKERAAFAFARKITYEPHLFGDADIKALKEHYTDLQILEMLLSVAGNNSINRWKEGAGVPQSSGGGGFGGAAPKEPAEKHTYVTPTAEKNQKTITKVAPLKLDEKGQPTRLPVNTRPALESRDAVEKALEAARTRTPRIKLADAEKVKAGLPEGFKGEPTQFMQLLANFSSSRGRISGQLGADKKEDKKGDLTGLVKAKASWIIARQDRAWYATEEARLRLKALGQTDDQIYALDVDWKSFSEADRALFTLAKKLASSPVILTDDDVALVVKLSGPRLATQMISYVTTRASFDRITEAAGLTAGK